MAKKQSKKSEQKKAAQKKHVKKAEKKAARKAEVMIRRKPKTERDIAVDFVTKVHGKFDTLIKASVLFGSQTKHTSKAASDIDIALIIDDASVNWDLELIAWYREEMAKMVASNPYGKDLHINTVKLTTWWKDLIHGDPVVVNMVRYGEPLIDIGGFFAPIKALLTRGQIHTTPEAIHAALQRAPAHLARSRNSTLQAVEGIYWSMVDAAQAALMSLGQLPPSPEKIPMMLTEHTVQTGKAKPELVQTYKAILALHKSISHGEVGQVRGSDIDIWQQRAEQFILAMTAVINQSLEDKKN